MNYIKYFEEIGLADVPLVGGKNASLGEMINNLAMQDIQIPTGFAITAHAYWYFLRNNNLEQPLRELIDQITDYQDIQQLQKIGLRIRSLIENGWIPDDLTKEIEQAYKVLGKHYKQDECTVAVRSSATAEDLPDASFAGQQETYLNITGLDALLKAYRKSLASLFTDRALVYRFEKGFDHFKVALSTGVQKMVRSDKACAGVMFTLDTDTGFPDVIVINASWGLGELVVKGEVTPDEFIAHKPTLRVGYRSIIKKQLGSKKIKMVYGTGEESFTEKIEVSSEQQQHWALRDDEILELAHKALCIEDYYSRYKGSWSPMDIEWAKDGIDGKLYIVQARPETVQSLKKETTDLIHYTWPEEQELKQYIIATGMSIGQAALQGRVRLVTSVAEGNEISADEIIVTHMTDPDWVPLLKRAAGIITSSGGRTCHAAIVSRELGIPAIVGAEGICEKVQTGQEITMNCTGGVGYIYQGKIPFKKELLAIDMRARQAIPTKIMMNVALPDTAFAASRLPNDGVGLARIEFIISSMIRIHPMACVYPERITDESIRQELFERAKPYDSLADFFICMLAQEIAIIAVAFYPRPVIVRTSDFKSNEYRNLLAGSYFEPQEENPMLGWRGASRYYSPNYQEAFKLECAAFKKVRQEMGCKNVKIMLPFVRTIQEAEKVIALMKHEGLERGVDGLELIMMCEIPSNVLLIDKFSQFFDGFSIGSNDLTQLTLGVDRDSGLLKELFDERDEAVKKILEMSIKGAHYNNKPIGICGQAPSDYPEIARFLISLGIDSLSLNPDSILPFINGYGKKA